MYGFTVDPIELEISLFGRDINIRDSHFALLADLRSRSRFFATIEDMINGNIDTSPLIPDLTLPFSTEFAFDVPVTDQIILTPIMAVESGNLVDSDLAFDFDVDIGTFMNNVGENNLTSLLQSATIFLQEVALIKPELKVSDTPSALDGFFDIVNQLNDLANQLSTYTETVDQGALNILLLASSQFIFYWIFILTHAHPQCKA